MRRATHILPLAAGLSLLLAGPARADDPSARPAGVCEVHRPGCSHPVELDWDPQWRRFETGEWFVAGGAVLTLTIAGILGPRADHWERRNDFDEGVRDGLRLPAERGRAAVADASDVFLSLLLSYPLLIDPVLVASWYRDNPELGLQIFLVAAEAMVVTAGLMGVAKVAFARERPYVRECGGELDSDNRDCRRRSRFQSFFSGHSALSFVSAGVVCGTHRYVPLYGGGGADAAPCPIAIGAAAAVGLFRVMADHHYASDVLLGAAVGMGLGLLFPWLHFRGSGPLSRHEPAVAVVPHGLGLALVGDLD